MKEIEIRGKLSKEEFAKLFELLKTPGKLLQHYRRLSIDLSPGFDPKTRTWKKNVKFDLRLKKSNEEEKISLKIGDFHLKEREEIDVRLQPGQFLNALTLLETLGFNSGMIYVWESWEFTYEKFEIKLSKYTDAYYTWEIESKGKSDPFLTAKLFYLHPFTKEDYRKAFDWENQNIHQPYSREVVEELLKRFSNRLS